jgi:hypothetical protein
LGEETSEVMRRRIFNFASIASLLICGATAALWARSYWYAIDLYWRSSEHEFSWSFESGAVDLWISRDDNIYTFEPEPELLSETQVNSPTSFAKSVIGFAFGHETGTLYQETTNIQIPCSSIAVLTAAFPIWRFIQVRKRTNPAAHFCRTCSYNLTVNTSGVCPECGTVTGDRHNIAI